MPDLDRFLHAQASSHASYATATAELRRGCKSSHWIWYVFPQIEGLGRSDVARRFAIEDVAEAEAYLAHPVLGARLLEAAEVVLAVSPPSSVPLEILMGAPIDVIKLVSSLTLFGLVARQIQDVGHEPGLRCARLARICQAILEVAAAQGYAGCAFSERVVTAAR
jgi:uncharacterized protein (DUF1810 family)